VESGVGSGELGILKNDSGVIYTDMREISNDVKGRWTGVCHENDLERFEDEKGVHVAFAVA
jgi:hypothetical protein